MRSVGRVVGMKKSKENVDATSGAVASVDKQACSCETDEPEKRFTYYVGGPLVSYSSSEEDEEIETSSYSTAVAATAVSAKTSRATATVTSASIADAVVDTVSSEDTGASLAELTGEPKANYTPNLGSLAAKLEDSATSLVEVTGEPPWIPYPTSANSDSTEAKGASAASFEDFAAFPAAFNVEPGSSAVDNSESSTTSGASETPFKDSITALAALAAYSDEFSDVSGDSAAAYTACAATHAESAASPAVSAATTCSAVSCRKDGSGHI